VIDIKQSAEILGTDDAKARIILSFFKVRVTKSEAVKVGALTPKPKNLYDESQVRAIAAYAKF
jgi:hypothetical protein